MEARSGDPDGNEPMSTNPSPDSSSGPPDTPGSMSVESSPQHASSGSPRQAVSLQPPPLSVKKPPSTAVSITLLRSLATNRATSDQNIAPPAALPVVPSGASPGVPPGLTSGASPRVPPGSPPVGALPTQSSGQQAGASSSLSKVVSCSAVLFRSVSDPLSANPPDQEDASDKSAFSSVPSNLSSAFIRTANPILSSDDEELSQIFNLKPTLGPTQRSFDHVPKRDYRSDQVLDSCSSESSPGIPEGLMLIRPPSPTDENPSDASILHSVADGGSQIPTPDGAQTSSSIGVCVVPGSSAHVSATHSGGGDGAAAGRHDASPGCGSVPEFDTLHISPKAAKDAFARGVARTSQRGQRRRSNPYHRPPNTPQLRKSSSRESKSDEEEDSSNK